MKIIYIILGSLLAILLLSGCVSLRFFDPQYYKFKYLVYKESGKYIYDEEAYNNKARNFTPIWQGGKIVRSVSNTRLLSNGYEWEVLNNVQSDKISSRIIKHIDQEIFYTDSLGNKHIINRDINFSYLDYGIFIGGDEGAGFWVDTSREIGGYKHKVFILKDNKWVKIEN